MNRPPEDNLLYGAAPTPDAPPPHLNPSLLGGRGLKALDEAQIAHLARCSSCRGLWREHQERHLRRWRRAWVPVGLAAAASILVVGDWIITPRPEFILVTPSRHQVRGEAPAGPPVHGAQAPLRFALESDLCPADDCTLTLEQKTPKGDAVIAPERYNAAFGAAKVVITAEAQNLANGQDGPQKTVFRLTRRSGLGLAKEVEQTYEWTWEP